MIYKANKHNVNRAVEFLKKGEIIIYPTDTIYGFGVDATNSDAIIRLNQIKQRKQPYSIIVSSINMLKRYIKKSAISSIKLKKYFPGPYTLIFPKNKNDLSDLVTLNLNTIGIRIPDHQFPREIVSQFKKPIITTSVNIHNSNSLVDINKIMEEFPHINIFKDSKMNNTRKGSTIIDVTNNSMKILRQGAGKIVL